MAAQTTPLTVGTSGTLSATATFEASGTDLMVTLTNDSAFDVLIPVQVLTTVFFNMDDSISLTPVSASLGPGSVVHFGSDGGGNVGGEWAYEEDLSGILGHPDADRGIGSAGLSVFGLTNFNGPNLNPPPPNPVTNGLDYGIVSKWDDISSGNAKVTGKVPLIQDSVVFELSGLPAGFDPSTDIYDVTFQYGTSLGETTVPEPGTLLLLGSGLVSLAGYGRFRRRKRL